MPDNRVLSCRNAPPQPFPQVAHQVSDFNYRRAIIPIANPIAVPAEGRDTHTKKFGSFRLVKKLSLFYRQGFFS